MKTVGNYDEWASGPNHAQPELAETCRRGCRGCIQRVECSLTRSVGRSPADLREIYIEMRGYKIRASLKSSCELLLVVGFSRCRDIFDVEIQIAETFQPPSRRLQSAGFFDVSLVVLRFMPAQICVAFMK